MKRDLFIDDVVEWVRCLSSAPGNPTEVAIALTRSSFAPTAFKGS